MSTPNPDCPKCYGTGSVEASSDPPHPPTFHRCECMLQQDILSNTERGMRGLSKAPPIKTTPLLKVLNTSLRITAGAEFLSHLRHVAIRQPTTWSFKVISDAELVTAWLASIALKGQDILDADAYKVSTEFITIPDLVVPPDLVILRMGIKVARNAAASEVLAEAVNTRFHEDKPTWIWEEPANPIGPGHLFWSDHVGLILRGMKQLSDLSSESSAGETSSGKHRKVRSKSTRKSLRGGGGQ